MSEKDLRLLIKFPTRGRPAKLLDSLDKLIFFAEDIKSNSFFIEITADEDDYQTHAIDNEINEYKQIVDVNITYGESVSKIFACNRDLGKGGIIDWDIVLLMSDDMTPIVKGYDTIIRKDMKKYFPDTDGILYYPDGYTPLNTMCILGKQYYNRFGYIYHPDYISLWCDNEFDIVGDMLGKQHRSTKCIFRHDHPIWTGKGYDTLYKNNDKYYHVDEETFNRRRLNNFDITINTDTNNS